LVQLHSLLLFIAAICQLSFQTNIQYNSLQCCASGEINGRLYTWRTSASRIVPILCRNLQRCRLHYQAIKIMDLLGRRNIEREYGLVYCAYK